MNRAKRAWSLQLGREGGITFMHHLGGLKLTEFIYSFEGMIHKRYNFQLRIANP